MRDTTKTITIKVRPVDEYGYTVTLPPDTFGVGQGFDADNLKEAIDGITAYLWESLDTV